MTPSLLCETVTGRTMAELTVARDTVIEADMVELRLDGVSDVDVPRALDGRRVPAIVTCRPTWEGGRFEGSEEERRRLLSKAFAAGAEYVDIEWRALGHAAADAGFDDLLRANGARVVVSSHDFEGTPRDVCAQARAMRATGAAVVKVAVTATRLADTLPLLEVTRDGDAVVVGMGEAGLPTRLLASRFGSRWTYGGDGVAPGQVPAARMIHQFRFREIRERTAVYGVVGDNVMHSVSPAMHNAAFAAAGLDAAYVPLRAFDFQDFLTFADALGIAGASVTIPFKVDALQAASVVDNLARRVGTVNTLRRVRGSMNSMLAAASGLRTSYVRTSYVGRVPRSGHDLAASGPAGWEATNTDVAGFLEPLEAALDTGSLRGRRASVLGAGGAARAVIVALLSRDARVTVHARRQAQAQDVATALGVDAGPWPPAAGSWDVLVNCTPLGSSSAPEASPMPGGPFDGGLVYDLTYRPGESPLCRDARRAGCATLDGLPMLVAQAERQFAWWTGQRPPAGVMRAAAENETRLVSVS